jgi:hypothetical protein
MSEVENVRLREVEERLTEHEWHLKTNNGTLERMCKLLEKVDERQDVVTTEITAMKTKLAFYAAIGALVGSGAMSLIVLKAGG